jgi:DHA3 family macrolide efflux protein-like MFS transporter
VYSWKKNIALFLTGQAISLIGSSLVGYAIMWHVTLGTQSGVLMTIFTIATTIPLVLISPFGGVWADRYNKRFMVCAPDAFIAVITLVIALSFVFGADNLILLFTCTVVRTFGQGIQMPAVNALIPEIVPEKHLLRVNGINSSIQSVMFIASPALGGLFLSFLPIQSVLFVDVITAIIGIGIVLFLVKTPTEKKSISFRLENIAPNTKSYFADLKDGMKYIRTHSFLKRLFFLFAMFSILISPAALLTPLQVARDFGPQVWRLSALEVCFSAGMIVGGIIIASWGGFKNKVFTIAFCLAFTAITTVGLGLATNFVLYLAITLIEGLLLPFGETPIMTILQTKVDKEYMGRVFSVSTIIGSVAMPIGMCLFGPLGDIIKIDYLLIATGVLMVILSIIVATDKLLRKAGE